MSYTNVVCKVVSGRGVVLVLLVAGVLAVSSGTVSARPSHDTAGTLTLETQVPPAEQHEGEPKGQPELPWLFAVFFITWAAFFAYVFIMSRRQREMQREIEALGRALAERERRELEAEGRDESQGSSSR